ncbi:MAG: hypothetical protein NC899_07945, partial [Candidatus Omnitrophica bacterium]|nr:hypothetical protein [Candidatus Omnitrophota bacterium]
IEEWIDPSFKKIKIDKRVLKKGKNRIEMSIIFVPPKKKNTLIFRKEGTEIENIYLIGNFLVKSKKIKYQDGGYFLNYFSISKRENVITEEDINLQGYPFYVGSLVGFKEIDIKKEETKKYFLKFDEFKCIVAEIKINKRQLGIIYLPPYEIEITDYLKEGKNTIEVELFSSLRNLFGPHHLKEHNPEFVSPFSFFDNCEKWFKSKSKTPDYSTLPFGIGKISLIEKYEQTI